ncbi:hypothetical protein EGW08_003265, partial [Elysia chlorotica]
MCEDGSNPDANEDGIADKPLTDVVLVVDLAGVDLVEEGHHDKRVEDHSKVGRGWGVHILHILNAVIDAQQFGTCTHTSGRPLDQHPLVHCVGDDVFGHGEGDERFGSTIWFSVQQLVSGQLGGQSKRGQRVHDQVDPQHLDGLQRAVLWAGKHRYNIDCKLKLQELCDTVVDIPSPHHCLHNTGEVVIRCSSYHGKSNISFFQRRSIVGSVSSDSHDLASGRLLAVNDAFHKHIFILRGRPRQNSEVGPNFIQAALVDL